MFKWCMSIKYLCLTFEYFYYFLG